MNFDVPQAEKYWRDKIASEVADAMIKVPDINAYGVWLLIKGQK